MIPITNLSLRERLLLAVARHDWADASQLADRILDERFPGRWA